MIEKLEIQEIEQPTGSEYTIIERVPATSGQMHDKINELVDAVNDITDWIKRTDETIVKCGIKPIPEKIAQGFKNLQDHRPNMVMDDPFGPHPNIYEQGRPADPYAKQRKWIGKLCWFSQLNGIWQHLAILKEIKDNGLFITDDGGLVYCKCKPVKPDDDIIYKGGDNE